MTDSERSLYTDATPAVGFTFPSTGYFRRIPSWDGSPVNPPCCGFAGQDDHLHAGGRATRSADLDGPPPRRAHG